MLLRFIRVWRRFVFDNCHIYAVQFLLCGISDWEKLWIEQPAFHTKSQKSVCRLTFTRIYAILKQELPHHNKKWEDG